MQKDILLLALSSSQTQQGAFYLSSRIVALGKECEEPL